ncbi:MAG: hypothetical protein HYY04_04585 [Chloroflexi bacterium]|nr:hypothetical protein [Chloroflexota bacterium]
MADVKSFGTIEVKPAEREAVVTVEQDGGKSITTFKIVKGGQLLHIAMLLPKRTATGRVRTEMADTVVPAEVIRRLAELIE